MKPQEFIMVGAGGHALSLAEFAGDMVKGYIAKEENPEMPGIWLGDDSVAPSFAESGSAFHMAFVYSELPVMKIRKNLLDTYKELGARFVTLVAPSAIINRARISENVIINSGAILEHDCVVEENSFVGPGAVVGGFTKIGKNCFIGLGARIGNGLTIADNITVAMGAIVNKDLSEPGIYHGFPLKRYKI